MLKKLIRYLFKRYILNLPSGVEIINISQKNYYVVDGEMFECFRCDYRSICKGINFVHKPFPAPCIPYLELQNRSVYFRICDTNGNC